MLYLGVDAGSVYVGLIVLDENGAPQFQAYHRHHGEPGRFLLGSLSQLEPLTTLQVARTGASGAAMPLPGSWYDAVISGIEGTRHLVPDVRNILSVGGGSFSLTELDADGGYRRSTLNSACASGTGAFIDQQSLRLQIPPSELPQRAMRYEQSPPPVATRCAVFAKSDMIHLQQEGYSIDAIACGLCTGLGHSTVDGLLCGRKLDGRTVMIGGVALNSVVVKSIIARLGIDVVVPGSPELVGALGAALLARTEGTEPTTAGALVQILRQRAPSRSPDGHPPEAPDARGDKAALRPALILEQSRYPDFTWADSWVDEWQNETAIVTPRTGMIRVALGIDIGSTSTKATLLDEDNEVVGWVYRKTAGDPIRAVQLLFVAIRNLQNRGGFTLDIQGVGTTGSGRKMIQRVIGADLAMNEITAHATAALFLDPKVDTIIELGGQDAKFTQLQNGMVYNSVMNYVCAAGTGSFIEEQAQKLGISLDEFAERAMGQQAPRTSDRCTVYMERDLDLLLARGWSKDQAAAAVLHSVRDNYLNKVVGGLHIGDNVYFQGATARNRALVAAFELGLRKPILVSRFCHLTGALGMALLVRQRVTPERCSRHFKGLAFADAYVRVMQEICDLCRNRCALQVIHTGETTVAWGLKCGRHYATRRVQTLPNPHFAHWQQREIAWRGNSSAAAAGRMVPPRHRVGLPRSLATYSYFPYWRTLLQELDCEVVFPKISDEAVLRHGTEMSTAEYCAPVLMGIGHAGRLLSDAKVDYLLVPHMIAERIPPGFSHAYFCCYLQAHAAVLKSLKGLPFRERILTPVLSFADDPAYRERQVITALAGPLGVTPRRIRAAMQQAQAAQDAFGVACRELGKQALAGLETDAALGIVCVGRPYNTTDAGLTLDIPRKIAAMGYAVLYQDMIEADPASILPFHANMYWHYGQRILAVAEIIARSPRLFGVFFTNFMCGPDSYLLTYFKAIMGRLGKPYLCLQLDGHGADAGYLTRVEAALETFHAWSRIPRPPHSAPAVPHQRTGGSP